MGHLSTIYGKIVGDRYEWGSNVNIDNDRLLYHKLNKITIEQLPVEDEFPQLTRQMFNIPAMDFNDGLYKNQIVVFGASYKEVENNWYDWIYKFEKLLKNLYWTEAVVHLETELNGNRIYRWKNNNKPAFIANKENKFDNWTHNGDDLLEFEN